jgi:non-specific serine/threonine protein kinase/serine/threonine-protein kinase
MNHLPNGSTPNDDLVTSAQPSTTRAVEMIGPYRLLQRVGEGGRSLARRTDSPRQSSGRAENHQSRHAQVVARFEAERHALAVMDHPAIARVFDAGSTPHGRSYFVMEYVRGESITTYCNRHKLSICDRIPKSVQSTISKRRKDNAMARSGSC